MAKTASKQRDNVPAIGEKTQFSKENQPAKELKSKGWAQKKQGQELAKLILNFTFKGSNGSDLKTKMSDYFNVDPDEITVEQMMYFRQVEKALAKSDTIAFNAIMARAFGQPKQEVDQNITFAKPTIINWSEDESRSEHNPPDTKTEGSKKTS